MGTDRVSSSRGMSAFALVALLASSAAAQAPAGNADTVKAAGQFPVSTETSLVIRGIPGQVVVSTKPARELRFTSRAKDKSGSERLVAVSFHEGTVTLAPPPGVTLPDGTLRVDAPASFAVRVESEGGTVLVDGFAGGVAIKAKETVANAQALTGQLDVDVVGGSLRLTNLAGPVTARIRAGCKMTATDVRGGIDLNSQDSSFKMDSVAGSCRVEAHGGSGEVSGLAAGGELRLSESALRLAGGHGELNVTSDAAVEFANMAATMRFDMDGGTLHGKGNQGKVDVRARRTEVALEAVVGAVRVEGEELKAKLVGLTGELHLDVTRGTVLVQRMLGPVDAVVYGGDAQLLELQGAARLDLQGGNAEVGWLNVTGESDTLLKNSSGDIAVHLPANANCRVTAKTRSGHVTSDLPSIKVAANATEVQGTIGQGQRPLIEIEAEGNIRLVGAPFAVRPPS